MDRYSRAADATHEHDHDRGLAHDLSKVVERSWFRRRGLLVLFGGVGAATVVAGRRTAGGGWSSPASSRRRTPVTGRTSTPRSTPSLGDGYSLQLAAVTGSNAEGYLATLNVPV